MAKRQQYTVTFNTAYDNAADAMYYIGSNLDSSIRNTVNDYMLIGDISDNVTPTQSDNGLVLTVDRNWTDSAYNELMLINTEEGFESQITALSQIDSCSYGFTDI